MSVKEINSYPSIYAIGHRAISDIFTGPVVIEEKIDGSQFSMMRLNGELFCRSKSVMIMPSAPEPMFQEAVAVATRLPLQDGWIYRGEYLKKPKHNTLAYSRIPENHIMIFDVQTGPETYLVTEEKRVEAERIGLECVPVLYADRVNDFASLKGLLDRDSALGGCKIEGVVVKNYAMFTPDKKAMMGKFVSEAFKERHGKEWRKSNPTSKDVVLLLIAEFRSEARWRKAIEHLRDAGKLEMSPRDIGCLIKEIPDDILTEAEDDIKDVLFKYFWPQIRRGVTAGLPEFYKHWLAENCFDD